MGLAEQRALGRRRRRSRSPPARGSRSAGSPRRPAPERSALPTAAWRGSPSCAGPRRHPGPGQAVRPAERLLDRPLGHARPSPPGRDGVRRGGQTAVGHGLDAGRLLGANDGLHERPGATHPRLAADAAASPRSVANIGRLQRSADRPKPTSPRLHPAGPNGRRAWSWVWLLRWHAPGPPAGRPDQGSGHPDAAARTGPAPAPVPGDAGQAGGGRPVASSCATRSPGTCRS